MRAAAMARFGRAQREELRNRQIVEDIVDFLEIEPFRKSYVGMLPYGVQKRVELGRALAMEPRYMMFDEPTSALDPRQIVATATEPARRSRPGRAIRRNVQMSSRQPRPSGQAIPGSRSDAPGGARSASVLVVDDEPGMRNFLRKALASRCALVETADSVETAEALRRRYHFDLLVVDIRLPGESGVEWVTHLREQDVHTDVIVMTAYADLDTAVAALRAGAADFLLKPFALEQMMESVRRCLERRRLARENYLLKREREAAEVDGILRKLVRLKELALGRQLGVRLEPTHQCARVVLAQVERRHARLHRRTNRLDVQKELK